MEPVKVDPAKSGRMTGEVPTGWRDDSSWAKVTGAYRLNEFEGVRFLEVKVERIDQGSAQFVSPFPGRAAGNAYALSLTARSERPVSFEVLIVQSAPPYRTYWSQQVRVGRQFEELIQRTSF